MMNISNKINIIIMVDKLFPAQVGSDCQKPVNQLACDTIPLADCVDNKCSCVGGSTKRGVWCVCGQGKTQSGEACVQGELIRSLFLSSICHSRKHGCIGFVVCHLQPVMNVTDSKVQLFYIAETHDLAPEKSFLRFQSIRQ